MKNIEFNKEVLNNSNVEINGRRIVRLNFEVESSVKEAYSENGIINVMAELCAIITGRASVGTDVAENNNAEIGYANESRNVCFYSKVKEIEDDKKFHVEVEIFTNKKPF